jgi:hypothetical protein
MTLLAVANRGGHFERSQTKSQQCHADGLPVMADFEVPTCAFSYDGHLFVFVANELREPPQRMTASHLAGLPAGSAATVRFLPPPHTPGEEILREMRGRFRIEAKGLSVLHVAHGLALPVS